MESARRAQRVGGKGLVAAATIFSAMIGPVVQHLLDDSAVEAQNPLCEVAERRMAVDDAGIAAWREVELARIAAQKEVELARIDAAVRVDMATESPP